jgi:hypothetical protein
MRQRLVDQLIENLINRSKDKNAAKPESSSLEYTSIIMTFQLDK